MSITRFFFCIHRNITMKIIFYLSLICGLTSTGNLINNIFKTVYADKRELKMDFSLGNKANLGHCRIVKILSTVNL